MKIKRSPKYYKVLKVVEFSQFNENLGFAINSVVGLNLSLGESYALFEKVKDMPDYYCNGTTIVTEEEILSKGDRMVPYNPQLQVQIVNVNELSKVDKEEFEYQWSQLSKKNYAYLTKNGQIPLFISLDGKIPRKKKKEFKKTAITRRKTTWHIQ